MEFTHCWAIVLRHARLWMRDVNLILVTLYWPLLDVLIWGFIGAWMQRSQNTNADYTAICLFAILLWQTTARSSIVVASSFIEEIMASNLVNLFSLPLRISEWISGVILFSCLLITITNLYCMGLIYLFYRISVLKMLWVVLLFAPPLFLSGIALGFFCLQIIASLGKRAQELAFILSWFFAPLCGAFYPLDILPEWIQKISYCFPMAYAFEGMRNYMIHGINPAAYIAISYALSTVYLALAITLFIFFFNRTKIKGLARLSD
jgi:ABC-2 type transport system permease protein